MKLYRQLLRAAALPIQNRKWAAPLSAVALGFGLFVGVAIGPGAAGTLATGATEIIEVPGIGPLGSGDTAKEETSEPLASGGGGHATAASSPPPTEAASASLAPLSLAEPEPVAPIEEPEATEPEKAPPAAEESEPDGKSLEGLVVHLNEAAGSYVVAGKGGEMTAVHAPTAPQLGTQVEVPIRPLANGTYAEAAKRVKLGEEEQATVSGIVTYFDPDPAAPLYTLSKRGVSMLVHVRPDPTGAVPTLPEVGAFAKVAVEIEAPPPASEGSSPPEAPSEEVPAGEAPCAPSAPLPPADQPRSVLWQRHLEAPGTPLTYGDFSGVVLAVCPESDQLLLSSDDVGESGGSLLFDVPAEKLDLSGLEVGSSVLATATIADGELSLAGLADDEHQKGADDDEALQGDLGGN